MAGATEFRIDLDETFPHLDRAPIVEAVIHWTAKPDRPFVADDLQQKLRDTLGSGYPTIERGSVHQFGFRVDAEGASTQQASRWQGFRLTSADGRYIAQFNHDGLVFSRLAPYEDWEQFSNEGRRLWRVFCDLGAISEVQRSGVRFINRIPLSAPTDVGRFLRRPPYVLENLGLPTGHFVCVTKHDVPHQPLEVEVIQTIQPPTPPADETWVDSGHRRVYNQRLPVRR